MTGARWSLPGVHAMLLLRATCLYNEFSTFWKHQVAAEQQRLYQGISKDKHYVLAV
ncbi:hypothetical protein [Haloglycomyces albus]|uniref:hypothetical protein n=1 Tax=Haloglycomyces albus TaxID=526067 RepID=UPI0012EBEA3E|nr:hypothetical protein [Haloglycomyces albus]